MVKKDDIKNGVGVWIFNSSGKILLGLRLSKHGNGTWAPPGGKIEKHEIPIDAAIRETLEETGILLDSKQLTYIGTTEDLFPDSHYITRHYRVDDVKKEPAVIEKDKCERWQWFDINKLPDNLFLPVQNLLKKNIFGV